MMIKALTALMRGYTVTGAKSFESTDGLAYSGTIYKDGAPVLRVVNTGTGAPSDLAYANKNAEAAFKAAALNYWRATEGDSAPYEPTIASKSLSRTFLSAPVNRRRPGA